MDQQNIAHPYSRIQCIHEERQSSDALTCVSLGNTVMWKKPNIKGNVLYGFYLHESCKMGQSIETETTLVARGWGEGK